jgi:UDP-galactopyranose mutase
MLPYDYLVVGAGLFGATFAWHAVQRGKRVLVIDKRDHIAGNVYTKQQEGIHVHTYGPHIFHTSDHEVWAFVNKFASFHRYVHHVKARNGDRVFSLPINLMTMYQLWGVTSPSEAEAKLAAVRVPCDRPQNMEDWALSQVGPELYELLFKGYTTKQWGHPPNELPASILKRLPIRLSWDDDYFTDTWQGIPAGGYTRIVEQLLEGSEVRLRVDYLADRQALDALAPTVVYTGPIDAYFGYSLGQLEYRTMSFDTQVLDVPDYQGCAQLNWTGTEVPWTRTVEHKHFEMVNVPKTVVTWETPSAWQPGSEPYYPVCDAKNNALYVEYKQMADQLPNVRFGGRLGTYKYYDMHQVIAQALHMCRKEGLLA